MLHYRLALAAALLLTSSPAWAADRGRVSGDYVEARTAEVFAGGCIMNSEAETAGRQAVMAWRITTGRFDGVALDGLAVTAAVVGDRNLGMREMGGEAPQTVRAIITVDARATAAQQAAPSGAFRSRPTNCSRSWNEPEARIEGLCLRQSRE